jgi:hypothetical protein
VAEPRNEEIGVAKPRNEKNEENEKIDMRKQ